MPSLCAGALAAIPCSKPWGGLHEAHDAALCNIFKALRPDDMPARSVETRDGSSLFIDRGLQDVRTALKELIQTNTRQVESSCKAELARQREVHMAESRSWQTKVAKLVGLSTQQVSVSAEPDFSGQRAEIDAREALLISLEKDLAQRQTRLKEVEVRAATAEDDLARRRARLEATQAQMATREVANARHQEGASEAEGKARAQERAAQDAERKAREATQAAQNAEQKAREAAQAAQDAERRALDAAQEQQQRAKAAQEEQGRKFALQRDAAADSLRAQEEKEQDLLSLELRLRERAESVEAAESRLTSQRQQFEQQEAHLRQREDELRMQEQMASEQAGEQASKEQDLANKSRDLRVREQLLMEREAAVSSREAAANEHERISHSKPFYSEGPSVEDARFHALNVREADVAGRGARLEAKEAALAEREQAAAQLAVEARQQAQANRQRRLTARKQTGGGTGPSQSVSDWHESEELHSPEAHTHAAGYFHHGEVSPTHDAVLGCDEPLAGFSQGGSSSTKRARSEEKKDTTFSRITSLLNPFAKQG